MKRLYIGTLVILLFGIIFFSIYLYTRLSSVNKTTQLNLSADSVEMTKEIRPIPEDAIIKTILNNKGNVQYELYGTFDSNVEINDGLIVGNFQLSRDQSVQKMIVLVGTTGGTVNIGTTLPGTRE